MSWEKYQKHENRIALVVIIVFVFIFNYEAIFGLKTLVEDDFHRYFRAINKIQDNYNAYGYIGGLIKELNKQMMLIDIQFARMFYVIVFAIPLSFLVFYLNKVYFKFPFFVALFGSVLINIMPFQTQIPIFIDGSYPVYGLVFFISTIVVILKYLKTRSFWVLLVVWLLWYLSCYHFSIFELNLFLFPSVLLLIAINSFGSKRQRITLITTLTLIISYSYISRLLLLYAGSTRGSGTPVELTYSEIIDRFEKVVSWSSLIPENLFSKDQYHVLFTLITFVACIIFGIIIIKYSKKKGYPKEYFTAIIFYLSFSLLALFPFVALSPWIAPRHLFVSQVGIIVVLILSIDIVFRFIFRNSKKLFIISPVFLLVITLLTGWHRHDNLKDLHTLSNNNYFVVCNLLENIGVVEPNSQIVITGYQAETEEHFLWSSGLFSFCLQKPGIVGILGNEYSFYDPFISAHRAYFFKMGGLNLNDPIFVFRRQGDTFYRPDYALRWIDRDNKNSSWTIYRINKTKNLLSEFASGKGIREYILILKETGLSPDDILWGNYDASRGWTKINIATEYKENISFEFNQAYIEPINHYGFNEWTLSVLIKPSLPIPVAAPFYSHYTILEGNDSSCFLGLKNSGLTHSSQEIAPNDFMSRKWHHVSFVYCNGILSAIIEGIDGGSISIENPLATVKRRRIGQRGDFAHYYMGQMMHVQLWDRALSQDEIRSVMKTRLSGNEPGLAGYWPLDSIFRDEGTFKTPDLSPSKNHGILVGDLELIKSIDTVFVRNY